jgi:hypothetical protein
MFDDNLFHALGDIAHFFASLLYSEEAAPGFAPGAGMDGSLDANSKTAIFGGRAVLAAGRCFTLERTNRGLLTYFRNDCETPRAF